MKLPNSFAQLEEYKYGHLLKSFHNLRLDVINADSNALHSKLNVYSCSLKELKSRKSYLHWSLNLVCEEKITLHLKRAKFLPVLKQQMLIGWLQVKNKSNIVLWKFSE